MKEPGVGFAAGLGNQRQVLQLCYAVALRSKVKPRCVGTSRGQGLELMTGWWRLWSRKCPAEVARGCGGSPARGCNALHSPSAAAGICRSSGWEPPGNPPMEPLCFFCLPATCSSTGREKKRSKQRKQHKKKKNHKTPLAVLNML